MAGDGESAERTAAVVLVVAVFAAAIVVAETFAVAFAELAAAAIIVAVVGFDVVHAKQFVEKLKKVTELIKILKSIL